MKRLLLVGGARPNFMKLAPLVRAFDCVGIRYELVHTGQHYDQLMSDIFFQELNLPKPKYALGVSSGTPEEQSEAIVQGLEPILLEESWDAVLVVGDVTSTAAATIAAVKAGIRVIHVEAGLRSSNTRMAEERNRIFVDKQAQWLFTTEPSAREHLLMEGIPSEKIHEVGNVMVDTMRLMRPLIDESTILPRLSMILKLDLKPGSYGVVTLHRAELLKNESSFREVWEALGEIAKQIPLIAPLHPRTADVIHGLGLDPKKHPLYLTGPMPYTDMQRLVKDAKYVWTDSGGLQEETTVYGVPCFTIREETERPITIIEGTNVLVGCTKEGIDRSYKEVCTHPKTGRIPLLWDGHAAERIAKIVLEA